MPGHLVGMLETNDCRNGLGNYFGGRYWRNTCGSGTHLSNEYTTEMHVPANFALPDRVIVVCRFLAFQ
jgi:hypothetical protein